MLNSDTYIKTHNSIEKIVRNSSKLHIIEDHLRYILIKNANINNKMILLLARIMWGRNYNSIKENGGLLDKRHIKAQLITTICISIYLNRHINKNSHVYVIINKLYTYHYNNLENDIKNLCETDEHIKYLFKQLINKNYNQLETDITKIINMKNLNNYSNYINKEFYVDTNIDNFNIKQIKLFMVKI
jgi:hypothetical protein